MVTRKMLTFTLTFVIAHIPLILLLMLVYLLQLPFRLMRYLVMGRPRRHRSKVHLTIHEAQGDADVTPRDTILLLHGFPDGPSLWSGTVSRLTAAGFRCLVASLPGCRGQVVDKAIPLNAIPDMIRSAVLATGISSVTVIGHDWGAFYALLLRKTYPKLFHRAVFVDVGNMRIAGWPTIACIVAYQTFLALCYLVGDPIGTQALRGYVRFHNYSCRPLEELYSDMAWVYVSIFRFMASKFALKLRASKSSEMDRVADSVHHHVPTMFVYGAKKSFLFHDELFLREVRATPQGLVQSLDCGHWVMHDKPDEWAALLLKWLDTSKQSITQET